MNWLSEYTFKLNPTDSGKFHQLFKPLSREYNTLNYFSRCSVLTLIHRLPPSPTADVVTTLTLTAEERTRSRGRHQADDQRPLYLNLRRGTVLQGGDLLVSEQGQRVRVIAKAEPILMVTAITPLQLLQAAYHLGNRHVPLEITPQQLRLQPDPVLESMLNQLPGLQVTPGLAPFEPEAGAYRQGEQAHSHHHRHPERGQSDHG